MGRQFQNANSQYGAPMGRRAHGIIENQEPHTIELFKVAIDSGGYDDGGAYWGIRQPGRSLYCARSQDGSYRQFTDAASRDHAALLLGIEPQYLIRSIKSPFHFGRFTARHAHIGASEPGYVVEEFGQVIQTVPDYAELCEFAAAKEGRA